MEEILHHLGCIKPYKHWDKLPINCCRFSSTNSPWICQRVFWNHFVDSWFVVGHIRDRPRFFRYSTFAPPLNKVGLDWEIYDDLLVPLSCMDSWIFHVHKRFSKLLTPLKFNRQRSKKNDALEDHVYFCRPWGFSGKFLRVFFLAVKNLQTVFFLLWRLWHPEGYPILWGMGCFDHQILGIFGRETWILREIISNLQRQKPPF